MKKDAVAIILARGGSKRLPGKNLMKIGGRSLVRWSMEAALASGQFDQIILASDSDDILNESKGVSGTMAYKRSSQNASDQATTMDALFEVLQASYPQSLPRRAMLLQPTSPLRLPEDISKAFDLIEKSNVNSVISVCPCEHSPFWTGPLSSDLGMEEFLKIGSSGKRSQDLPPYYRLNGAIYLADTQSLFKEKTFFMPGCKALVMPTERSVDVDSEFDFKICKMLIETEPKAYSFGNL